VLMIDLTISMFVATAAIALVTAGLVGSALSLRLNPVLLVIILLGFCATLLIGGRYHLFERVTKGFVALLIVLLVLATSLVIPDIDWEKASLILPADVQNRATWLFIVALAGWMPSPLGVAVFQSLWVAAKSKDLGVPFSPSDARFDFNFGYMIAAVLAMGFLILGPVLMYQPGVEIANSPNGFAEQLIALFTTAIGGFAYPVITIAAIAVMLSSLLTIIDACPRGIGALITYRKPTRMESANAAHRQKAEESTTTENKYYVHLIVFQCLGALAVLTLFESSFRTFIDFATSVAFLTSSIMAYLNHRAMFSSDVPPEHRPSKIIEVWSLLGILALGTFAVAYIYFGVLSR
jgi:Mn2+/Fe2+ NRAMP family transporter